MASFILIKLDGDDAFVIGQMHNETDDEVVLRYPIIMRFRNAINETTNVTTSKLMPFSENNIVAVKKSSIVGFSKPNEKIIKYYLAFLKNFQDVLDKDLEDDICSQQESNIQDEEDYNTNVLINTSRYLIH